MNYLILSQPSEEYAKAVSHELWMLARPRGISDNETSQYYCGVQKHNDGRIAIGPLDGTQPVHKDADALPLGELISDAVTLEEKEAIIGAINNAKGGSINILSVLAESPSLSSNLLLRGEMEADGWFSLDEI